MIRKILLWTLSIWYIIISVINYKLKLTWKLVLHDMLSGFRDNRIYLMKILMPVTVAVFIFCIVFVLLLERKVVIHWEIQGGGTTYILESLEPLESIKSCS